MQTFFWPKVSWDVKHYRASCDTCQRLGGVPPESLIGEPFQRVAIDIVGPLKIPDHTGKRYILTLVDFTRYPEAVALSSTDAERVAQALIDVVSRLGYPQEVVTDQWPQFQGELLQMLWEK